MIRRPRHHDEKYLAWIRELPCLCCGDNTATEAAHVRMPDIRADKRQVGLGEKPDDIWTLPLCSVCHRRQHEIGERRFWDFGVTDPIFICLALRNVYPDAESAGRIILEAR